VHVTNSVTNVHQFGPRIFSQYKKSIISSHLMPQNISHVIADSLVFFIKAYKVFRKRKKIIISLLLLVEFFF
jgi:hypothetical protein